MENREFLTTQILTYLGNKRSLRNFIEKALLQIKADLNQKSLKSADLFSGSGVVSRLLKSHSHFILANDLELYSKITNECYIANRSEIDTSRLLEIYHFLKNSITQNMQKGFISELYSPKNDEKITKDDRAFYTNYNAAYIDTARILIEEIPSDLQKFFIAPLLYLASVHSNTGGVFKGFYKNKEGIGQFGGEGRHALGRIEKKIELLFPVFSEFSVPFEVRQTDANALAKDMDEFDLVYLDPPYNAHPYGSNYFMLNLIASYERPKKISKISGIDQGWNKSVYNKKSDAAEAFFDLIENIKAKYIVISFNSEGFISKDEFIKNLEKFGSLDIMEEDYNAYRASRNLQNRNIYVKEYLYILRKR